MPGRRRRLKLGLIGCGRVTATRHLPALRTVSQADVVALADIDRERLRRVADGFQVKRRYAEFRALLDDPDVEAVAVCVPPQFHVEVALAALDAGKHLFVEKPLALSLEESERLVERAGRSHTKTMMGFNLRWHRRIRQARELIQQGMVGPPELMRTAWTASTRMQATPEWKQRRALGGGVLLEIAVHHVDLWRFLLGSEVEEVFAASRSEGRDDETATLMARMANGVLATSAYSDGTSESHELDVYGPAGRLHVSCYRIDGLEFSPTSSLPGDVRTRLRGTARLSMALLGGASIIRAGGEYLNSYRAEWEHFIEAIHQDTPVECTLDDGRRALAIILAAAASASSGRPRKVGPTGGVRRLNGNRLTAKVRGGPA